MAGVASGYLVRRERRFRTLRLHPEYGFLFQKHDGHKNMASREKRFVRLLHKPGRARLLLEQLRKQPCHS